MSNRWTPDDVQDVLIDPRSVGVGGFPPVIDDATWIKANVNLLGQVGAKNYLTAMLVKLREIDPA